MLTADQIRKMSAEQKLQTIEALWEDLSKSSSEPVSPAWHEHLIERTNARLEDGSERVVDWESAKKELRSRE
jgi:hypothetical protein